jgi:ubiquinone/menaquinone biosynthesis C-methylase UbiE
MLLLGGNVMSNVVEAHNVKAQSVWNSTAGRYDEISRSIADAIEHAVARVDARPGERILDLATGTGWASRSVAQRSNGVKVIGADIADQMLDYARAAAARHELDIQYRHADAERLPFADGEFDAVVSTFGVMFAGNPEAACAEIARVVKPGGRVVLATWKPDANVFHMFGVMKKHMPAPPAGAPAPRSPFEWGKVARVEELLAARFDLGFEHGTNHFRYASGEQAWQLWVNHYGPTKSLAASLDDARREELRRDLIAWHETFASPLGFDQPRDYLVVRGVRK